MEGKGGEQPGAARGRAELRPSGSRPLPGAPGGISRGARGTFLLLIAEVRGEGDEVAAGPGAHQGDGGAVVAFGLLLPLAHVGQVHPAGSDTGHGTPDSLGPAWGRHKAGHTGNSPHGPQPQGPWVGNSPRDTGGDSPAPGETVVVPEGGGGSGPCVPTRRRVGGSWGRTGEGAGGSRDWRDGDRRGPGRPQAIPGAPGPGPAALTGARRSPGPRRLRGLPAPRLRRALRHCRGHPREPSRC